MSLIRIPLVLSAVVFSGLAPAQERASLVARVPPGWENVIHLRDVVPVVERVLASPRLEEAWKEAAAGLSVIDPSLRGVAPRFLLGPLGLVKEQVPTEIVFALPAAAFGQLGAAFRGGMHAGLGWIVRERGAIDEPALEGYLDTAAELLEGLESPVAYVAVRARSERGAETWFDAVVDALETLPQWDGVRVEIGDDSIELDVDVGVALSAPGPTGRSAWEQLEAAAVLPADHPATARIRRELGGIRLVARLDMDGEVLTLRVGDVPEVDPGDHRAPHGWSAGAEQLFYAAWESYAFDAHSEALLDTVLSLGEESVAFIEQFRPGAYEGMVDRLFGMVGDEGEGRLSVSVRDDSVEIIDWMPLDPDLGWSPLSVRDTGLARWSIDGAALQTVTGYFTLDEWLFVNYDDAVTTLDQLAVGAWERGLESAGDWANEQSEYLTGDLAELYEFLGGEDSAVFDDGVLVVVDVAAEGDDVPGLALVGRPSSEGEARGFVRELARAWRSGFGDLDGEDLAEIALQQGVTAYVPRVPGAPADAAGLSSAACAVHAIVADDVLILSTRAELSRRLLAARAQAGDAERGSDLVGEGRTTGRAAAAIVRHATDAVLGDDRETRVIATFLRAFAELAELPGDVETEETLEGDGLASRIVIRFDRRY